MNKFRSIDDTLKYFRKIADNVHELDTNTAKDLIRIARDAFYTENIKISNCDDVEKLDNWWNLQQSDENIVLNFKLTLSADKIRADFNNELMRVANGLIIQIYQKLDEKIDCRVLSVPSNNLTTKIDKREIQKHLDHDRYDIYEVNDGTTLRLYFDDFYIEEDTPSPRWVFATRNMPDVENISWRGKPYKEVIAEVLDEYPEFDFEKLDKSKTYLIGFNHPAFHPFAKKSKDNKVQAWQLSGTEKHGVLEGIPSQLKIGSLEGFEIPEIDEKGTFQSVLYQSMEALKCYKKNKDRQFLGVILRSRDESKTKQFSDVLVESTLWKSIKNLVYNQPKSVRNPDETIVPGDMNRIALQSYLDITKKNEFVSLFPRFNGEYNKIRNFIKKAAEYLAADDVDSIEDEKMKHFVSEMSRVVEKQFKPEGGKKNKKKNEEIISNIICNPEFSELYYDTIYG